MPRRTAHDGSFPRTDAQWKLDLKQAMDERDVLQEATEQLTQALHELQTDYRESQQTVLSLRQQLTEAQQLANFAQVEAERLELKLQGLTFCEYSPYMTMANSSSHSSDHNAGKSNKKKKRKSKKKISSVDLDDSDEDEYIIEERHRQEKLAALQRLTPKEFAKRKGNVPIDLDIVDDLLQQQSEVPTKSISLLEKFDLATGGDGSVKSPTSVMDPTADETSLDANSPSHAAWNRILKERDYAQTAAQYLSQALHKAHEELEELRAAQSKQAAAMELAPPIQWLLKDSTTNPVLSSNPFDDDPFGDDSDDSSDADIAAGSRRV